MRKRLEDIIFALNLINSLYSKLTLDIVTEVNFGITVLKMSMHTKINYPSLKMA